MQIERIEVEHENDLLKIPGCLRRSANKEGIYVANGNIKKGYEWVFDDPDVICAEHIHGTNVNVIMVDLPDEDETKEGKVVLVGAGTRNSELIGLSNKPIISAIWNSSARGFLRKENILGIVSEMGMLFIPGVIPSAFKNSAEAYIVPRVHQLKKMRYTQWRKVTPTIENISDWLREDLNSHFKPSVAQHIGCGRASFNDQYRPNGLLFYQPSTGAMARITCDMFDWYWEEKPVTVQSRSVPNENTKEHWLSLTIEQQNAIRQEARTRKLQGIRS